MESFKLREGAKIEGYIRQPTALHLPAAINLEGLSLKEVGSFVDMLFDTIGVQFNKVWIERETFLSVISDFIDKTGKSGKAVYLYISFKDEQLVLQRLTCLRDVGCTVYSKRDFEQHIRLLERSPICLKDRVMPLPVDTTTFKYSVGRVMEQFGWVAEDRLDFLLCTKMISTAVGDSQVSIYIRRYDGEYQLYGEFVSAGHDVLATTSVIINEDMSEKSLTAALSEYDATVNNRLGTAYSVKLLAAS